MRALLSWLMAALPLAGLALGGAGLSGCTTQAVCFRDCQDMSATTSGGTGADTGSGGLNLGAASQLGFGGGGVSRGGGALEDAGTACDNVDLQTDSSNCGQCGNHCIFTGADASCEQGKCVLGACTTSHYDLDADPSNGCEYTCLPAADPTEICNYQDDNCNGVKDEGFDLTTDAKNCGVCQHECQLLHALSDCEPGTGMPACVVTECEPGFWNIDGIDSNGCEYACVKTAADGTACAPGDDSCGAEVCDALDNDCNGKINDGKADSGGPDGGTPCADYCPGGVCHGECTPGITTCVGTALLCVPGKGPKLETCDGKDNDCDNSVDEDFNLSTDTNNCGACGVSCSAALPNAVAKCSDPPGAAPPICSILVCKPGFKDLDPTKPGCEACPKFPTSAETCNGVDDDCDGIIDNVAAIASQAPAAAPFCNNGRALAGTPCAGTSVSCGGLAGWVCNYPSNTGVEVDPVSKKVRIVEQLCDALDGNCDGQKDEAFLNKGASCSVGTGICSRSATYACKADKTSTTCTASAVATDAVDEVCNGLDDDCDGQVDERSPTAGATCYNGGAHACLGYTEPMVKVGATWVYTFEASHPDATGADAGLLDARSCSKAGVLPWTSISRADAEAACEAVPTSVANTKMRLCTEDEWQTACLAGGNVNTPTWAFSANPTLYDDLVCNDAANGLGAAWATSFNNGQSKRCRTSTQLWDMTGNVSEWTSTCFTVFGKSYCRVRGGSFLSLGPATACGFSFVAEVPTFANFDLGFRCCSSAAP